MNFTLIFLGQLKYVETPCFDGCSKFIKILQFGSIQFAPSFSLVPLGELRPNHYDSESDASEDTDEETIMAMLSSGLALRRSLSCSQQS